MDAETPDKSEIVMGRPLESVAPVTMGTAADNQAGISSNRDPELPDQQDTILDDNTPQKNDQEPLQEIYQALLRAVETGDEKAVLQALDDGADIEKKISNDGETALNAAARCGHDGVVEILLSRNANRETRDDGGRTPLCRGVLNGHRDVVQRLVRSKCRVDIRMHNGWSPFEVAITEHHHAVVELLVEHVPDIDEVGVHGWTPLMHACRKPCHDAAEILIRHHADVNRTTEGGAPFSRQHWPLHSPFHLRGL